MTHKVAVVGAGIIGMTNAIVLLENGFDVTVFTKDDPLATNSDAAVATWFAPNNDKALLQKYCLKSLEKFDELIKYKTPGVDKISELLYFKTESDFKNSVWAKESVRKLVELSEDTAAQLKIDGFPFSVLVKIPLINPIFYRPHMLEHFKGLGGKLIEQEIISLNDLVKSYPIVINSPGWEAKQLTLDDSVYPVRGQTEICVIRDIKNDYSLNVEALNAYVVFRPATKGDGDCVLGTTYQINDTDRKIRASDKQDIISKISTFFPIIKDVNTHSKVGIRCGRNEVRVEEQRVGESMIVHCYGHGGSGYSASWGSAHKVLEHCNEFVNAKTQQARPKI
ncbi:FAD-dependent oxidoreductase [Rickettsiella endosymbiont of Miltochrista miniata]|uniref:FAD-dependent oxidoreductase n=1 Tax=Rickettsiella endosymbiont of Miltochrista miniata TaxID=3066239 RepID=UPI00313D051C